MTVNVRQVRSRRRDLLRALGVEIRRLREDVGLAQADARAELPELRGRFVSRLLVVRTSHAMREVVRAAEATLGAAHPAGAEVAVAALSGLVQWPGPALVWMRLEGGRATLMDGPPPGIRLGR